MYSPGEAAVAWARLFLIGVLAFTAGAKLLYAEATRSWLQTSGFVPAGLEGLLAGGLSPGTLDTLKRISEAAHGRAIDSRNYAARMLAYLGAVTEQFE
jgi:hypothetical protein